MYGTVEGGSPTSPLACSDWDDGVQRAPGLESRSDATGRLAPRRHSVLTRSPRYDAVRGGVAGCISGKRVAAEFTWNENVF
jgi:hypothetical protein